MQTCKTGDQPYSDTTPNGECSLVVSSFKYATHSFLNLTASVASNLQDQKMNCDEESEATKKKIGANFRLWAKVSSSVFYFLFFLRINQINQILERTRIENDVLSLIRD